MRLIKGRLWKKGSLGIIGGALVLFGLLGPWLWQGEDPWYEFNYATRKTETHYHKVLKISPLRAWLVEDGSSKSSIWLYDINLSSAVSLAGVGLIVGAILSSISFGRWRATLTGLCLVAASSMLFFSSFGRGLSLGISAQIGWGVCVSAVGGIIIVLSLMVNLLWDENRPAF